MRRHRFTDGEGHPVDITVAVVSFGRPEAAQAYHRHLELDTGPNPTPVLLDHERHWYRTFGFERGSAWSVWGPTNIAAYARLLSRGRRLRRMGRGPVDEDLRQLGGDVIIAPDGRVASVFHPTNPDDRPTLAELNTVVADLAP